MVICFIGDSLTQGIGDSQALGWVGRLARNTYDGLHRKDFPTIYNLGVRGEASVRIAQRWRADTDLRRRPGEDMAFVFSFGAADGLHKVPEGETMAASRAILETAASLGRTYYIAPPPAHDPVWSAHIKETGERLRGICAGCGVPTFDFHAPLSANGRYMETLALDGIHPDAHGYEEMAALLRGWRPLMELLGN